jgi:hypothetical protein
MERPAVQVRTGVDAQNLSACQIRGYWRVRGIFWCHVRVDSNSLFRVRIETQSEAALNYQVSNEWSETSHIDFHGESDG